MMMTIVIAPSSLSVDDDTSCVVVLVPDLVVFVLVENKLGAKVVFVVVTIEMSRSDGEHVDEGDGCG